MTRPVRRPALLEEVTEDAASELAVAIREGTEAFAPAVQAIAKFATNLDTRLDALCAWLRSLKTWAMFAAIWAVTKYAPADLVEALKPLIQGAMPQ